MRLWFEWIDDPEVVFGQVFDEYEKWAYMAIANLAAQFAARIETWMKKNAVWTDRTGNARQTLYAEVEKSLAEIAIVFDHGMDYGYWLEFANQGAYAIIAPTLDYWGPRFWAAIQDLFAA